jgi:beta-lactamase regulating signal transducer with metallopeptidase domain
MLEWIVLNTLTAAALASGLLVLGRCVRLRPATRHALWLVVLLKLVTPPVVYWPWPLPGVQVVDPAAGESALSQPVADGDDDNGLPLTRLEVFFAEVRAEREAVAPPAGAPPLPPRQVRWSDVALGLWVGGGIVVGLVQVGRILRFRRLLAQARPGPAWLVAATAARAAALGVRPPVVRVLPGVGSPMVWGFGPARLLWPEGLEECLAPAAREAVVVHELAHLRRRDHWVGWLLLAGGIVWWWHPLFRFVRRQLGLEAELACDAWVVGTLPGARRAYAEALLEVSQWVSRPAVPVAALGAAGSRLDFQRRLVMVMREETPCRLSRQVLAAVGVLALLVIPAWTLGQAPLQPVPVEPPAKVDTKPTPDGVATNLVLQYYTALTELQAKAEQPGKAPSDRDKKLDELEKKLKDLLKELQALKAGGTTPAATPPTEHRVPPGAKVDYVPSANYQLKSSGDRVWYEPVTTYRATVTFPGGTDRTEVVLTRATYKLPAAKAQALGAFLGEHVKATVMEIKVEGENLIVTTTPEAQRTIGQFIALVLGKVAAPHTSAAPANAWYGPQTSIVAPPTPAAQPVSPTVAPLPAPAAGAAPAVPPLPAPDAGAAPKKP